MSVTSPFPLGSIAKSFAVFGRLPDGPAADVDVAELLRYATRATIPPTMTVELDLREPLPFVLGHHDPLSRAVSNILLNAIDAAGSQGTITVSADVIAAPVPSVRVRVRDSGTGIAPAQLSRIWEPYVTAKAGGTGLGLAIVKQTILAHGGEVSADSEVGHGTTITLTLPVAGVTPGSDGQHE